MVKKSCLTIRRWAARWLSAVIVAGLIVVFPASALAFTYTDTENQLRIEVPEDGDTYYYTPTRSNLFEDLHEQIQNSGRDVRILVRTYTDQDLLGYSLEVAILPVDLFAPEASELPAGSIYRNVQGIGSEEKSAIERAARSAYGGRFNLSAPRDTTLQDIPAIEMEGTGVDQSGWGAYDCNIYLLAAADNLLMVSLIFDAAPSNEYMDLGRALLRSLVIGPAALEEPAPEPTPTASVSIAPVETSVSNNAADSESVASSEQGDLWSRIQGYWSSNFTLVYLLLGVVGGLVLVGWLIGHRKSQQLQQEAKARAAVHREVLGYEQPSEQEGAPEKTEPQSAPCKSAEAPSKSAPRRLKAPEPRHEDTKVRPAHEDTKRVSATQERPARAGEREAKEADAEPDIKTKTTHRDENAPVSPQDPGTRRSDEEDLDNMVGDAQEQYRGKNFDYTEDISRYTQQPGPEVNDVSRYTHGYTSERNELDTLKDLPPHGLSRSTRQSVGSRVDRNRSRRKRKS